MEGGASSLSSSDKYEEGWMEEEDKSKFRVTTTLVEIQTRIHW